MYYHYDYNKLYYMYPFICYGSSQGDTFVCLRHVLDLRGRLQYDRSLCINVCISVISITPGDVCQL